MSEWIDLYSTYFFSGGWEQAVTLAAVLGIWVAASAWGGALFGRLPLPEAAPLFGWAVAAAGILVPAALAGVGLGTSAWIFLALALPAAMVCWRRHGRLWADGTVRVAVLALPLLVMVSAMIPSQWDEFSHWITAARFAALEHDLPRPGNPNPADHFPGYPYHWTLLTYLVSRLAGGFVSAAGAVLNVALMLTFGLVLVRAFFLGAERETPRLGWGLAAMAALGGTLLAPTFVEKVVLTGYADAATAVALGLATMLGWMALNALAGGDRPTARTLALQLGLVLAVAIGIKQTNPALIAALLAGIGLVALTDPKVPLVEALRLVPRVVVPALALYLAWRYFVVVAVPAREASFLPFDQWLIPLIPRILGRMLLVASQKGGYFGTMVAATAAALWALGWRRGTAFERLAVMVGTAFVGYNAFLLLTYVAYFGEYDALRAASYWRYNMHLGMVASLFAAVALGLAWRRWGEPRVALRRLAWLPIALVVAAPIVMAKQVRFDGEPPKPHLHAVGRELLAALPPGSGLVILDPLGTGESNVITTYHLDRRHGEFRGYLSAFHDTSAANMAAVVGAAGVTHVLVHSVDERVRAVLAPADLPGGASYLLERRDDDGWRVVKTWPYPAGHHP